MPPRNITAPGDSESQAVGRHGLPDAVAGAENAEGITPEMRAQATSNGLDSGPKKGEKGEYLRATYKTKDGKGRFIRMDR